MKSHALALVLLLAGAAPSSADVMRTAAVGCNQPADAEKIAALLSRKDRAAAEALARPLVASRACIDLAKGITIDVDERHPPLACVRLTGDLSCYWIAAGLLDEHPGEKGGGGKRSGGRRQH